MIIEVPQKIWRPKPLSKDIPLDYGDDISDAVFEHAHYGKAMFRPPTKTWKNVPRKLLYSMQASIPPNWMLDFKSAIKPLL